MDDLLKLVGALVAVVASLGAVAVVVEQFTLRSRLRKTEAWALVLLEHDTDGGRAVALDDIRLDATARIVAGIKMPLRFFAEGAVWAVLGPGVIVATARVEGASAGSLALVVLFVLSSVSLTARRTIRLYLERCRIASDYKRDLPVREPRRGMLDQMESGVRVEFAFALGLSAGLCALALGVGLALSGHAVDGWPLILMLVGEFGGYGVLDLLRKHAASRHPLAAAGDRQP